MDASVPGIKAYNTMNIMFCTLMFSCICGEGVFLNNISM